MLPFLSFFIISGQIHKRTQFTSQTKRRDARDMQNIVIRRGREEGRALGLCISQIDKQNANINISYDIL